MRILYLDMDGVLADFDTHHESVFGVRPNKIKDSVDWNAVRAVDDFYLHIPPMQDFRELWDFVSQYSPIILTGVPASVPEAADNKRSWVVKNIGSDVRVICTQSKSKYLYAHHGDVLVDDWEKYKDKWIKAGGIWVTHINATSTIQVLREIL